MARRHSLDSSWSRIFDSCWSIVAGPTANGVLLLEFEVFSYQRFSFDNLLLQLRTLINTESCEYQLSSSGTFYSFTFRFNTSFESELLYMELERVAPVFWSTLGVQMVYFRQFSGLFSQFGSLDNVRTYSDYITFRILVDLRVMSLDYGPLFDIVNSSAHFVSGFKITNQNDTDGLIVFTCLKTHQLTSLLLIDRLRYFLVDIDVMQF